MWGEGVRLANGIPVGCLLTGGLGDDVVQKGPYSLKETKPSLTSPCRGKDPCWELNFALHLPIAKRNFTAMVFFAWCSIVLLLEAMFFPPDYNSDHRFAKDCCILLMETRTRTAIVLYMQIKLTLRRFQNIATV